jgi:hypothetical protein
VIVRERTIMVQTAGNGRMSRRSVRIGGAFPQAFPQFL